MYFLLVLSVFYLRSPFLLHNGKEIFLFSSSFLGEAFTLNLRSLSKYFCVYWINHWLVFSIYCFLYPPPKSNPKLFSKHQSPLRQVNYLFPAKVISYTLWPRIWASSPPPTPGAQLSFGTPNSSQEPPPASPLLDLFLGTCVCLQLSGKIYGKKIFWILECLKCLYSTLILN